MGMSGRCSCIKATDVGCPAAWAEIAADVDRGELGGDFTKEDGALGRHSHEQRIALMLLCSIII